MEEGKIEFKLELSDVSNKCMIHIQEVTTCLTHIYHAINHSNTGNIKLLPTDSLPIQIDTMKPKPSIEEQKEITINWIITKAFEEFINGLTKSLKATYRCLKIYDLANKGELFSTKEEFSQEIQKIDNEVEDLPFPRFIEEIEKLVKSKIFLREEILSINKVRNCFEHRHGIVGEKDIKRSPTRELILRWHLIKISTEIDDAEIELDYEYRKEGVLVKNLQFKPISNEKRFKINDKITLDINDFNGISYTCILFVQELFNKCLKVIIL